MITISGLGVTLDKAEILVDISLRIEAGTWLGLIGPNGAGKSTLLRALLGEVPHRGSIRIDPPDRNRSRQIASVPQRPLFPEGMTVTDYVLLGRTPHISYLGTERPHDLEAAERAIKALELSEYRQRPLSKLSGGEQQRVILARAVAQEAPILLLDEPTTALDIGHQLSVLELVDRLRHQHHLTVIAAIHDLTLAAQFCDRLALLYQGRLQDEGEPAQVLTTSNLAEYFGARVDIVTNGSGLKAVVPRRT